MKTRGKLLLAALVLPVAIISMSSAANGETTLLAMWLINGIEIGPGEALTFEEEVDDIELEDTKTLAGKATVLCIATLKGLLLANGEAEIVEELNIKNEKVQELSGLALLGEGTTGSDCFAISACAEGSVASPIEVRPSGLPVRSLLYLTESGKFLMAIEHENSEILCLTLGINSEDSCSTSMLTFEVLNDPESGDADIPAGTTGTPSGTCSLGGAGSAMVVMGALALFTSPNGLVTVSSE